MSRILVLRFRRFVDMRRNGRRGRWGRLDARARLRQNRGLDWFWRGIDLNRRRRIDKACEVMGEFDRVRP
ncbi:hypothetical protein EBZ70_12735 [bacterium]|nr:hypothetical protein [bacterium]